MNQIIVKEIAALNDQEKDELKQQLLYVNEFGYSVTQWMKVTINGQERPMEEFYSTLIYIVEGLIPLVSIFCSDSSLYLTGFIKSLDDLFTPQIIAIITDLGIAVQVRHYDILEYYCRMNRHIVIMPLSYCRISIHFVYLKIQSN